LLSADILAENNLKKVDYVVSIEDLGKEGLLARECRYDQENDEAGNQQV
jgi:hypothetical protein